MSPQMAQILAPNVRVLVEPLEPFAFASFGTVIQNPEHSPAAALVHHNVVPANQGSALKYIDVSVLSSHYDLAPSRTPAKAVMNMFVCSPRQLEPASIVHGTANASQSDQSSVFPVRILERHPFTPQTFIPTGLAINDSTTKYLVVVAPTLPESGENNDNGSPYPLHSPRRRSSIVDIIAKVRSSLSTDGDDSASRSGPSASAHGPQQPKGSGKPDLTQVKAFIADGSQSVTYGPGTWHAPMVVLGSKSIDFVVVQYANGVALEDCQEIAIKNDNDAEGINVVIGNSIIENKKNQRAKL